MKPIVVSGLKPSGELHIGNYLGMLKNAVALQESKNYSCFYFIADYHALSQRYNPRERAKEIYMMAVDAIAAGLDPGKSTIFIQSHIPEHANLAWIFNSLTSVGKLEGMIEYKEKLGEGQDRNAALLAYPVLMAADILLYKAEKVPVGEDQRQHLEFTRDLVKTFNKRFGRTFKEPVAVLTKAPRVMSLDNPAKKMSKSLPKGCLYLSDPPKIIRDKVKSATTDTHREIGYDPKKRPGISNLTMIYSEFFGLTIPEVIKKFKGVGYADFKADLAETIIKILTPFQEKRSKLITNRKQVMNILNVGAKRVKPIAKETMLEVRRRIGLI